MDTNSNHGNLNQRPAKLLLIKTIHTIIWIFFNLVLAYITWAVITNKIDKWLWIGYSLFAIEGVVLLAFGMHCPLTIVARNYSQSQKENFDIFLPNWLAKYNKLIYTIILALTVVVLLYQIAFNSGR